MNRYRPYKGRSRTRKDKIAKVMLIVLFFSLAIPSAIAGYLQDGPQMDKPAEVTPAPDIAETVYDTRYDAMLRELASGTAGALVTGADIQRAEPLLYIAPAPAASMAPEYIPDPAEVTMLAKTIWGEARGIKSITEQAAVVWCALNRVDVTGYGMGRSVKHVITFPDQFHGYSPYFPTVDDFGRDLCKLAEDVMIRWMKEKDGQADVGRVLPKEYLWFEGSKGHNVFRDAYKSAKANTWGWTLPSPYES